jgi:anhydro-N-acetylmuramic acid kinase
MSDNYRVIGVMSGTSLDGIDLAYCEFTKKDNWTYKILAAETIEYSEDWKKKLNNLISESALEYVAIDIALGQYLGNSIKEFIQKHSLQPDFISSHGHTIFHQPAKSITSQIGNGAAIASICKVPLICDFRTKDVFLGGQGAPLVPIGDKLLFKDFDYCLNLGGIANISFEENNERIAFDICPANQPLNLFANLIGLEYDNQGTTASQGELNEELLQQLNYLSFYEQKPPKSLGREWVDEHFLTVVDNFKISVSDKLRTICEHVAVQIAKAIPNEDNKKMLVTGGGAYNNFLIQLLKSKTKTEIIIPEDILIQYKEALIFAFLGVLRMRNENNCLSSVTGASEDSCSGAIYTR